MEAELLEYQIPQLTITSCIFALVGISVFIGSTIAASSLGNTNYDSEKNLVRHFDEFADAEERNHDENYVQNTKKVWAQFFYCFSL
jgi:hypothetical protein